MAGAGGSGEAVALQATGLTRGTDAGSGHFVGWTSRSPRAASPHWSGPNAAGKSTLIKTWIGFERPTAGSVSVFGVDPWRDRTAALAQIGYVPQSPSLYRGLSVADHLDLASDLRPGFDASTAKARLEKLDILSTLGRATCPAASRLRCICASRLALVRRCCSWMSR